LRIKPIGPSRRSSPIQSRGERIRRSGGRSGIVDPDTTPTSIVPIHGARPGCGRLSTRLPPPAVAQRRAAEVPGAPPSSSEEDSLERSVPGATPLEWPLGRKLVGLLFPDLRPARLASRMARGTTNRKRRGGGRAAAAELPALLSRTSPAEVTGARRRGSSPARDGGVPAPAISCTRVGEGRCREPDGEVALGSTGTASSMWMSCSSSLGQAQPCTGHGSGGKGAARFGSSMTMSLLAGSISLSACRSGTAGPARIHAGRGYTSGIAGGVGGLAWVPNGPAPSPPPPPSRRGRGPWRRPRRTAKLRM
jgi:hypothetical protein